MSQTLQKLQTRLQSASAEYQKLQTDLSNAVDARQKLDAQLSENELVKKEFAQLTPANEVYKLIGPVLVKQEQAEAKRNVDERLDLITSEIKRVEIRIKDMGANIEKKKVELGELQTNIQQQTQSAIGQAGPAVAV